MKKSIIALMGLFTLVACSEDVYQDADEQNADMNAPPSFNNNDSGLYAGYGPGGVGHWGQNYISPWDVWFRTSNVNGHIDFQPSYLFTNGNVEDVTPYRIEVFAYAGLAYFDGDNDGTYNDPKIGFVAQIDNGNYPNLYANNQEVGNLIRTAVQIDMPVYPSPNSSFRIEDKLLHLPTVAANNSNPKYPVYAGFDFGGSLSTQDERDLLGNYGKVFFYEVHVYDNVTGALVLSKLMHPRIATLGIDPGWKPVLDQGGSTIAGNVPNYGSFSIFYFYDDNLATPGTQWDITNPSSSVHKCDSREVVFRVPEAVAPSMVQIDPTFKIILDFQATGQTGWVNSALHLNVTGR